MRGPLRIMPVTAIASEIVQPAFLIEAETVRDVAAREALLDRAMGPGRRRKSSEKLRRGRLPADGLAFVARDADGRVVGTVRLWDVAVERVISPLVGEMPGRAEGGAKEWGGRTQ